MHLGCFGRVKSPIKQLKAWKFHLEAVRLVAGSHYQSIVQLIKLKGALVAELHALSDQHRSTVCISKAVETISRGICRCKAAHRNAERLFIS